MGSYENIIKLEEMKKKVEEGDLETAQRILDTMDLKKIKNILDMKLIAEVYEGNGKYEEAKDFYLKIYEKTRSRKSLFDLLNIIIKLGDVEEAGYYYEQYERIAPDDFYNYIFRYYIEKMKGATYESLIDILEELKKREYIEKWAYELAKLYYKAGMEQKCIRECSDIILWFGEGPYVEKAKLLRSYYMGETDKEKIMQELKRRAESKGAMPAYSSDTEPELSLESENADEESKSNEEDSGEKEPGHRIHEDLEYNLSRDVQYYMNEEAAAYAGYEEAYAEYREATAYSEYEEAGYYEQAGYDASEAAEYDYSYNSDYTYDYSYKHAGSDEEQPEAFLADENIAESGNEYDLFAWLDDKYGFEPYELFGDYLKDEEIKLQLIQCLENILVDENNNILMLISGTAGSGKTSLAKKLAIFLNIIGRLKSQKLAKISAEKLNTIDIFTKKEVIKDCCLVIENASSLTESTLERVLELSNELPSALPVVFEENTEKINKLFEEHPVLMDLLQNRIYLQ